MSSTGILYVVGTPIGNRQDITDRAKEILRQVSLVLCEDTRVTAKLLQGFEIKTPTATLHQHTSEEISRRYVNELREGKSIALVSDAGTPNISDPGGAFVAQCLEAGIRIVPIPGVSALTAALSVCGFPADHFTFLGFPPHKKGRQKYFDELANIEHTICLYESTHRIEKTLAALPPDRRLCLGRELTKLHETIYRGTRDAVIELLSKTSSKGEFVIVIAPKGW